ncbi:MAG TPA: hypothetical protein PK587_04240 [Syntrophales bacterium]|nr:hypothetical protein [Syntrophales bacterium]
MANKANGTKNKDANVEAAKEIYEVARRDANIEIEKLRGDMAASKDEGFALGVLNRNRSERAYCDLIDAMVLYKMKKTKDYKKTGSTWEQFCEVAGYSRATAERIIEDMQPVVDAFSLNLSVFSGVSLKEIRYLGKTKALTLSGFDEKGNLIIDGETVPATPEEITAYIDHVRTVQQAQIDEKDADLRAKTKVLKDKEKVINRQARDLARYEKRAEAQGLTPEEDAFQQKMENLRTAFDGFYMCDVDPERMEELFKDNNPTPRMIAAYLTTLDYMRKQILAAHSIATDRYGNPAMCPEDAWQPGMGAALPKETISKSRK